MFLAEISKESTIEFSKGAIMSLVSIIIVFAVLFLIIAITELIFKFTGLLDLKKELEGNKENKVIDTKITKSTDIKDEDMMVAVLVATIDYREECKTDVKLVSVSEVK